MVRVGTRVPMATSSESRAWERRALEELGEDSSSPIPSSFSFWVCVKDGRVPAAGLGCAMLSTKT